MQGSDALREITNEIGNSSQICNNDDQTLVAQCRLNHYGAEVAAQRLGPIRKTIQGEMQVLEILLNQKKSELERSVFCLTNQVVSLTLPHIDVLEDAQQGVTTPDLQQ